MFSISRNVFWRMYKKEAFRGQFWPLGINNVHDYICLIFKTFVAFKAVLKHKNKALILALLTPTYKLLKSTNNLYLFSSKKNFNLREGYGQIWDNFRSWSILLTHNNYILGSNFNTLHKVKIYNEWYLLYFTKYSKIPQNYHLTYILNNLHF